MGLIISRFQQLFAAVIAAVLVTASIASVAEAEHGAMLRSRTPGVERKEAAALLELYAAESALARAEAEVRRLDTQSSRLEQAEGGARREAVVVQRSLEASQRRIGVLVRELYVQGEPDPIAVILGAASLDEAVAGIEGLSRAATLNERLSVQAGQQALQLVRLRAQLAVQRTALDAARRGARAGATRLAGAASARQQTLTDLRRENAITTARLAALQARAQQAERRSADIAATASPPTSPTPANTPPSATSAAPTPPVSGTRSLVVDAVAYHLPGSTASGLPVGVGVIAVDPNVIPLGTRVLIPGYGPAVAADVGTAIRGNIIDLWMPSTARARAWGRRTVTITIYG